MKLGLLEVVFFVVLLAMPVSAYWFVFRPQNVKITEARSEIEHAERRLEAGETLPELKIALRDARNNLGLLGG